MNEEIKRQIFKEWLEGSPKRDLCWRYQIEPGAFERVIQQMSNKEYHTLHYETKWDKTDGHSTEKK